MQSDPSAQRLAQEIERLDATILHERAIERRISFTVISVAIGIGIIIFGALLANFLYFQSEWTDEKFAASVQAELEVLKPDVSDSIRRLGEKLAPVYVAEARRQLPNVAPAFSRELAKQFDRLSADFQADTYGRLQKTEDRIRDRSSQVVFASYPGLAADAERQKLTNSFRKITDQAVTGAIQEFQMRFSRDSERLQQTILAFSEADPSETTVDLQKKFIRMWLQLLDEEIMKL